VETAAEVGESVGTPAVGTQGPAIPGPETDTQHGALQKRKVLLLGSGASHIGLYCNSDSYHFAHPGMVAGPTVSELCKRDDIELVIGKLNVIMCLIHAKLCQRVTT
jgi:hypothetical protein